MSRLEVIKDRDVSGFSGQWPQPSEQQKRTAVSPSQFVGERGSTGHEAAV